jgi:hypothetical protein
MFPPAIGLNLHPPDGLQILCQKPAVALHDLGAGGISCDIPYLVWIGTQVEHPHRTIRLMDSLVGEGADDGVHGTCAMPLTLGLETPA